MLFGFDKNGDLPERTIDVTKIVNKHLLKATHPKTALLNLPSALEKIESPDYDFLLLKAPCC